MEASLGDAVGSVRDERPGATQIPVRLRCFLITNKVTEAYDSDLMRPGPSRYEVYEDQAALAGGDVHRTMPHFTEWADKVGACRLAYRGRGKTVVSMTWWASAFPLSDAGWRHQKPHLVDAG